MMLDWPRAMARYNRWMNDKLYAIAAELSDEERRRDRGAFFKSIHGTLNHILVGDRVWLSRLTGDAAPARGITALDQELYADFGELGAARRETDAAISAWVETLTEGALAAPLRYVRRGEPIEHPLWWAVAQLFNHQTHHRGQLTTLLLQAGRDPGATDLFAMLLEEARAPAAG
jgi:uncharacterized damage-inducible protein DinB